MCFTLLSDPSGRRNVGEITSDYDHCQSYSPPSVHPPYTLLEAAICGVRKAEPTIVMHPLILLVVFSLNGVAPIPQTTSTYCTVNTTQMQPRVQLLQAMLR
jgi:hypothetical protein